MGKIHDEYIARYNQEIAKNPQGAHLYRDVWILFAWEEEHEISPWEAEKLRQTTRELESAGEKEMVEELYSGMEKAIAALGKPNPKDILCFERRDSNG